jgi:hypothetical protein
MSVKEQQKKIGLFPETGLTNKVGKIGAFTITVPGSGLNPSITAGAICGPDGPINLADGDFDYIGPSADGNVSASATTFVFINPFAEITNGWRDAIYSNTTGTPTNKDDILLRIIVAGASNISACYGGCSMSVIHLATPIIALDSTGDKALIPIFADRDLYLLDAAVVITTSTSGTDGVMSLQVLDLGADTTSVLATLTIPDLTADLDARLGMYQANVTSTVKIPKGRSAIVVEMTTAAGAGAGIVNLALGGYAG